LTSDASTETSRRGFVAWVAGALVLLGTLLNAVPFVGALVGRPAGGTKESFVPVGAVASLKAGLPMNMTFTATTQDAYIHETVVRSVWAVKSASGDVVIYSPVCPHLGCQYTWDTATGRFVCPCHTSIFDIEGKLLSGPAPRGLDTLQSKVVGGKLLVMWQRFKLATPVKSPIA
jgi:menaquinol-cytochrome c reductase iron-sulfur subunit